MSIYDVFSGGNRPFDKEEWAAAKQAQRKEAYELIDNTCSEMVASGDSFRQYLDVQGRFDRYSVANAILVSAQMPEATQLKEYSKWKANRVYVNKDAQKIIILEPSKEYTVRTGQRASLTMPKWFMIFPKPRQRTGSRNRSRNPCVSLCRL